ncbi:MAG: carboxylating nicotinate-nucleotide diphosphorylase [Methanotrichaceae archaeon]|nr:carboxylating nicotinate-nucleotide diphosphorylase [Methanotrichaceae archaeon]
MLSSELERFINEDIGEWDDSSTIVPDVDAVASVITEEDCVIAGLSEACQILRHFGLEAEPLYNEGENVLTGVVVLFIRGNARLILQAERLVLNFLSKMSGISTLTRECMMRVSRTSGNVRVACTRKTTPGFRVFEKKAVFLGGGDTHRFNLSDAVLIKDNHIKILGLADCLRRAKLQTSFTKKIEVEVENLDQMLEAAEIGVDIIMFDNMKPFDIKHGVELLAERGIREKLILEASGGISLENIEDYASTGVDVISMGFLTKNAHWTNLKLDIKKKSKV